MNTTLPARPADQPDRIGPYRILEPLGQGGMGIVYRGVHLESRSPAAIKTVRVPRGTLLWSIRREIHALARLAHPGVVHIVDEGVHEGLPWYAMELLQGQTLRQVAQQLRRAPQAGPEVSSGEEGSALPESHRSSDAAGVDPVAQVEGMPSTPESVSGSWWTEAIEAETQIGEPAQISRARSPAAAASRRAPQQTLEPAQLGSVLTLVRRLCAPLAFLHGEGIVHRDLKPDNVLVQVNQMPVLVDFGLMTQFAGEVSREALEVSGGVVGTMAYMAPEQLRGELVDARADLYALGCILYELVAGRRPFVGSTPVELYRMQLAEQMVPLAEQMEGVPPQLDDLLRRLLAHRPEERLGYADDVATVLAGLGAEDGLAAAGPKPRAYLYRPGLAGRSEPLGQLEQPLLRLASAAGPLAAGAIAAGAAEGPEPAQAIQAEAGGLILVGGESGVGKTRLVMEAARRARECKVRVLTGECVALSPGPGATGRAEDTILAALRGPLQAVADQCRERGLAETERLLGPRGKVLALYEPALSDLPGQERYPEPPELPAKAARLRLYSYLTETISALARNQPILLVLDDLQWADELTLDWLKLLVQGGRVEQLLVVGTYRTDEVSKQLGQLLQVEGVSALRLGRLEESAVGSMVCDMLALKRAPELFVRFLARHSEGNPFFVAEYLRTSVAEELLYRDQAGHWHVALEAPTASEALYESLPLPRSVQALVRRRLEGLSDRALELLEVASVLGREAEQELLEQVAGIGGADAMEAERELLARQVMEEAGAAGQSVLLRFVHDKLREVAYAGLAAARRQALHRAAAGALEARRAAGAAQEAELPAELATLGHHWEEAGDAAQARPCYLAAARKAMARYAFGEAERLYRAYLQLVESPTSESIHARNELGKEVLQFRALEGVRECTKALEEARQVGDRAAEGQSLQSLGSIHMFGLGQMDEALECFRGALAIHRELGDQASEARVLSRLATVHTRCGRSEEARVLFEQALSCVREVGDPKSEASILSEFGALFGITNRWKEARPLFEQAIAIGCQVPGNRPSEGTVLANLACSYYIEGRLQEARTLFEQALAIHREVGNRRNEGIALDNLAHIHRRQGRLHEAQTLFEQALAIARQIGDPYNQGATLEDLACLLHEQGRMQEGLALFEQALALHRQIRNRRYEGITLSSMGSLLHEQGRLEEALPLFEQALALHREVGDQLYEAVTHTSKASLERRSGRIDEAERLMEHAEPILRETGEERLVPGLCEMGHLALVRARSARGLLGEVEELAAAVGAGPVSAVGRAAARLRRAVEAFEAGESLFRGESVEDLPEGVRQWLVRRGELEAASCEQRRLSPETSS